MSSNFNLRSLSRSMYKILSDDSLSCPIVMRVSFLMCFSREKDLSPEQFVTARLSGTQK